ncbi:MAG: SsrA-binding protein SmpB [Victivallaceae bacterium]|nr:SsrA-binding protein SmpB [Victivallaceae bacterium]
MPRKEPDNPVLATNRKAFHDYTVVEGYETGIKLAGTEVKSCRARAVNISEAFIRIERNEVWIYNMHIATYEQGNQFNRETTRLRKLLLNHREILKIANYLKTKGGTVIPLKVYLKHGLVKLEIAVCQGKTHGDKREDLRRRDDHMEALRAQRGEK